VLAVLYDSFFVNAFLPFELLLELNLDFLLFLDFTSSETIEEELIFLATIGIEMFTLLHVFSSWLIGVVSAGAMPEMAQVLSSFSI